MLSLNKDTSLKDIIIFLIENYSNGDSFLRFYMDKGSLLEFEMYKIDYIEESDKFILIKTIYKNLISLIRMLSFIYTLAIKVNVKPLPVHPVFRTHLFLMLKLLIIEK